jgi:hypothetical protein
MRRESVRLRKSGVLFLVMVMLPAILLAERTATPSDSLAVHLQMANIVFLQGVEIPLDAYLINQTDHALTIPDRWRDRKHFRLECRDSEQRLIPYSTNGFINRIGPEGTQSLPPHDSLWKSSNVAFCFGTSIALSTGLFGQATGTYSVRAVYDDEFVSQEIRYTVVAPSGSEKLVFDNLLSIHREYGDDRMVSAVPMLEELLRLNPQTAYGPAILSSLRNTCAYYLSATTRDDKKAVEYAKRLVETYPNSCGVDNALYDIESLLPADEAIAYFSKIEATKTDTRAARVAKAARIRTRNEAANPSRWKL